MANLPSADIIALLEADSSLALTAGTNLFGGDLPTTPNNCVAVVDTMGLEEKGSLDTSETIKQPSVQIVVRHNKYDTGGALMQNILDYLRTITNQTEGGTKYLQLFFSSGINWIGRDENDRHVFSKSIDIMRN